MNIVFIGMPGSGKSTVSSIVAENKNKTLIEIDSVIIEKLGMKLQKYIDMFGNQKFKEKENEIIMNIIKNSNNSIISTPGSIIYYTDVMEYIKNNKNYTTIYLECPLSFILERTNNFKDRGVVLNKDDKNPFKTLYDERVPIYEKYYDFKVNSNKDLNNVILSILQVI